MKKNEKQFSWSPFILVAVALVIIAIILFINNYVPFKSINHPLLVGIGVAGFFYLTIDRLREMASRITEMEERTSRIWAEMTKEVQVIAKNQARESIQDLSAEVQGKVDKAEEKIKGILDKNEWLSLISPKDVNLSIKHLQPMHAKVSKMLRRNEDNADAVRQWIIQMIDDPDVEGTANDYHNLGVVASRDLDDKLLSIKILEKHIQKHSETPDPDILSSLLQDLTDIEDYRGAKDIADRIEGELDKGNKHFLKKWRPWVFLSDFYNDTGESEKAIELLNKAKDHVVAINDRAHILDNIAFSYATNGEIDMAKNAYLECLQAYPSHTPASLRLAKLYIYEGNFDDAKKIIESGMRFFGYTERFSEHDRILKKLSDKLLGSNKNNSLTDGINLVLSIVKNKLDDDEFENLVDAVKSNLAESNLKEQ